MGWYRYVFREHDVQTRATTGFADVEVRGVGVAGQYHVAGPVGHAIVGEGVQVVKELEHVDVGGFYGRGLLLGEIAEDYEEFVVGCAGVVSGCADDMLDVQQASVAEQWAIGYIGGILDLHAVVDGSVAVRVMLGFLGVGVVELRS